MRITSFAGVEKDTKGTYNEETSDWFRCRRRGHRSRQ